MKKEKEEINVGMGVGLGFIFAGIFTLNLNLFFAVEPHLLQKIFGIILSLIGATGMLIEIGKDTEKKYLQDIGIAIILFVPIFIIFLVLEIVWLKIFFAALVNVSLIFVGLALGKTFFSDKGSFKLDGKKIIRFIVALLTIVGALISALNAFIEGAPNLLNWFK